MFRTHSKITRKLIRRFAFVYTVIFLMLSLMILTASAILMLRNAHQAASTSVTLASDTLYAFERGIQEKTYFLTSLDSLEALLKSYRQSPSEMTRQQINLALSNFQTSDSSLHFVMLEDGDGNLFHSINYADTGIDEFIRGQEAYQELKEQNASYFSPILTEGFDGYQFPYCCYLTRQQIMGNSFLISLCYDAQSILQNLSSEGRRLSSLAIYNGWQECFYHSSEDASKKSFPGFLLSNTDLSYGFLDLEGYHYVAMDFYSSSYLVGTIALSKLLSDFFFLVLCLLAVYFIPLAFALLAVIPVSDRMLSPIGNLTGKVRKFSLGAPPVEIVSTGDEIEELSRSFRRMTMNINAQADQISQSEREKAVTYYKLLTTQLDPHFIYNTMNIINILARNQAYEDIVRVNTALTRVLRERLNTQNTTFERVSREIETLKQYQVIMDYRYHNQVSIEYDVDPSILENRIPKNILQPLVENSYYHGLTREDGVIQGSISILIYPLNDELVIEISDDGVGFDPGKLKKIRQNLSVLSGHPDEEAHIGIENICRRIRYLYEENFSIDIQSEPGYGATVILSLPLVPPEAS